MAQNKLERINEEITKLKGKIEHYRKRLDKLEMAKQEQENLQITERIRAICLTPDELEHFLKSGELPQRKGEDDHAL